MTRRSFNYKQFVAKLFLVRYSPPSMLHKVYPTPFLSLSLQDINNTPVRVMSSHVIETGQRPNRILQEISSNIRPLSNVVASESKSQKRSFDAMQACPTLTNNLQRYRELFGTVSTLGTPRKRKQYRKRTSTSRVSSSEDRRARPKLTTPSFHHPTIRWH